MTFERGFKSHANKLALKMRDELNLEPHAPLCPWNLADHLGIPVITLESLVEAAPEIEAHVERLSGRGSGVFSAITLFVGSRRRIIHNHSHAKTRQRSNLAHELAHALLMHSPHAPFCENGQRVYDSNLEAEASWLGPVLLVPNEAACWAMLNGLTEDKAAQHFGVSQDLFRFRYRMSGAKVIGNYRGQKSAC